MNYRMIKYTLGWMMLFEAAFFLVPMITAVVYQEWITLLAFVISAAICFAIGYACKYRKPENTNIYAREGFVIVSLCWILLSLFGCIPFILSGLFTGVPVSFIDALFETASGFTTTGSSIFPEVESLPKAILMWRSFTHWVGGMGVLVFIMAFLPLGGGQNMHIMRAESPGPEVSKLVPKVKHTALILYSIYLAMTVITCIALLVSKMSLFDAINTAFATAGTGGFGFRNDSFASFSPIQQIIVTIGMLLFSINFNSYYLILKFKFRDAIIALQSPEAHRLSLLNEIFLKAAGRQHPLTESCLTMLMHALGYTVNFVECPIDNPKLAREEDIAAFSALVSV